MIKHNPHINGGNKFSTIPISVTHLFLVAAVFLTCIVLCSLFEFCCTLSSPLMADIRIHNYELQSYNLEPIIIWRLFVKNLSPQQTSGWACCAGSSSSSTPHFGSPCSPFHDTFDQFLFFCLDVTFYLFILLDLTLNNCKEKDSFKFDNNWNTCDYSPAFNQNVHKYFRQRSWRSPFSFARTLFAVFLILDIESSSSCFISGSDIVLRKKIVS